MRNGGCLAAKKLHVEMKMADQRLKHFGSRASATVAYGVWSLSTYCCSRRFLKLVSFSTYILGLAKHKFVDDAPLVSSVRKAKIMHSISNFPSRPSSPGYGLKNRVGKRQEGTVYTTGPGGLVGGYKKVEHLPSSELSLALRSEDEILEEREEEEEGVICVWRSFRLSLVALYSYSRERGGCSILQVRTTSIL